MPLHVTSSLLAVLLAVLAAAAPALALCPPTRSPLPGSPPFSCPDRGAMMQGQPYFNEIINKPSVSCKSDTPNNACKVPTGCTARCEACDLYVRTSWKANQMMSGGFTQSLPRQGHQLAVPVLPCRGSEDQAARNSNCGGDAIFNFAAGKFMTPKNSYGLAINPTTRRGQHQLHVHIAKLQPSLVPVLAEVANKKAAKWGSIVCPGRKVTKGCSYDPDPTKSAINVRWVNAKTFAEARAIHLVYPDRKSADANTLVLSQPTGGGAKGTVVIRATDRQAECFLTCGSVCEDFCK